MRRPPRPESFEKFYYDKVATGEGCGCAERIIDVHEFNRLSGRGNAGRPLTADRPGLLRRLLSRLSRRQPG